VAHHFRRYVPVGERQRKAALALARIRAKGGNVQPVRIEGRLIAHTFWGKAWCDHLETFSDFENRLPRGRTYVRNGSVWHLDIKPGVIEARVQGSEMYTVTIDITPLSRNAWKAIKERCTGKIASLIDLLQGRLSAGVMEVVTDRQRGLFPQPREIKMRCSCPDWALMCKHVAAALYGVGARLDERPELLFLLRGVDHEELIEARAEAAVEAVVKGGKGRRIAEADLSEVFGVEFEERAPGAARARNRGGPAPAARHQTDTAPADSARSRASRAKTRPLSAQPTGDEVRALRERLDLSRADFARLLDVSQATISLWERSASPLRLQHRTWKALERAWSRDPPQPTTGEI